MFVIKLIYTYIRLVKAVVRHSHVCEWWFSVYNLIIKRTAEYEKNLPDCNLSSPFFVEFFAEF